MLVRAYPEIFINNTNNIDITDTTNAILNPDILEKYQDELLDNKNGCIFNFKSRCLYFWLTYLSTFFI